MVSIFLEQTDIQLTLCDHMFQGGIQGKVSLTAYVLVALLETGLESHEEERAVETAQQFLEDYIETVVDPYTAALVAYALTVRSSISAQFAVRILSNMAIRKGEIINTNMAALCFPWILCSQHSLKLNSKAISQITNQYQACLYLISCIFHSDSNSNEII